LSRLARNLPLIIFGDGEQTRDFVYIQDIVEANVLALKCEEVAGEIFNIGTGAATTINQLASVLLEITNKTHLEITHSKPRKGDIMHSVADISKARKKLGYSPKISLKDGLGELTRS
jgi:UDP-glucose 4-epimerase